MILLYYAPGKGEAQAPSPLFCGETGFKNVGDVHQMMIPVDADIVMVIAITPSLNALRTFCSHGFVISHSSRELGL